MITIKGKEIRPETISMWLNIFGFIASVIFYCSVEYNFTKPLELQKNPLQDSLVSINTKLNTEIQGLKEVEKNLLAELQTHTQKLEQQQEQTNKVKTKMLITIHSDWENLPKHEQDNYVNQLIKNLKKHKP